MSKGWRKRIGESERREKKLQSHRNKLRRNSFGVELRVGGELRNCQECIVRKEGLRKGGREYENMNIDDYSRLEEEVKETE